MKIASFPPSKPRPTTREAARHIAEEARLVLASLRGGPPHVARGELASGLRELRSRVRGRLIVSDGGGGGAGGVGVVAPGAGGAAGANDDDGGGGGADGSASSSVEPAASSMGDGVGRVAPLGEEIEDEDDDEAVDGGQMVTKGSLPPPPLPPVVVDAKDAEAGPSSADGAVDQASTTAVSPDEAQTQQRPFTPPSSPKPAPTPSTPHSVPPLSSPDVDRVPAAPFPPQIPIVPNEGDDDDAAAAATAPPDSPAGRSQSSSRQPQQQQQQPRRQQQQPHQPQRQILDPGPYAAPFLAVVVDPRAAGPHTLAALRALHRLLERGSIVQLAAGGYDDDEDGDDASSATTQQQQQRHAHETALEPIARGVLACRFEQTDAGADEAVEMAIADALGLLAELDAAGARAAEAALLRRVYASRAKGRAAQAASSLSASGPSSSAASTASSSGPSVQLQAQHHRQTQQRQPPQRQPQQNKRGAIRIRRLPPSVLMECFHAVFATRRTFVREGGGHHSPALSFHFERVLSRMIHCVFGGEDARNTAGRVVKRNVMSSGHVGGARRVLEFLVGQLSRCGSPGADAASSAGNGGWNASGDVGDDGRTLCLRLIQCCLRTGWGDDASMMASSEVGSGPVGAGAGEDTSKDDDRRALSRLVEDDLCLALLTTGQAIWSQHDELPAGAGPGGGGGPPPSGGSAALGGAGALPPDVSIDSLSEVCATLSLLWGLPNLRARLRGQFEAIFAGFYQRALSLLRRRPLPEYGAVYEANMAFDAEAEVILESLVDVLCLSSDNGNESSKSSSTVEELFLTYDCSETESDVASGLLVELSRCCGGVVDEEGEPYLPSPAGSTGGGARTPARSDDSDSRGAASIPALVARHRPVPDHLRELCFEALLGSLRRLLHGAESLGERSIEAAGDGPPPAAASRLRAAKDTKRRLHHAAKLFNEKPKKGLQYLVDNGMLPSPPTPDSVASFLRNGLVVGLDKPAVGQYLGELGKNEKDATESTPPFERDWFHKDLLASFCSSFAFQNLTVLDGLRMFLATFRLPGEAQMIDRILQAFAESVSRQCVEATALKVFSTDEKKASDAAYLLSFSIIMLNTDLHNENIRADRKMKLKDFIRNNKNYGKEISDKDLPVEYLEGIYSGIKEEQIRTLGEGADGSMTSERWKDVMRSAASSFPSNSSEQRMIQSDGDAKDLKELLLESSWQPIISAVSGLWGMVPWEVYQTDVVGGGGAVPAEQQNGSTLMGARLGIDLAYEMLSGTSKLGRSDIFQDVFANICYMSGLLSEYNQPTDERAHNFLHSIEHQSALTVVVNIAEENGDTIGLDGWKFVWGMIFELRDFQLISGRERKRRQPDIMKESDLDLLSPEARYEFCQRMEQLDGDGYGADGGRPRPHKQQSLSLMSLVFGSSESLNERNNNPAQGGGTTARSPHGKEAFLEWDDLASSDEEEEDERNDRLDSDAELPFPLDRSRRMSIGASFENHLVYESTLDQGVGGVTGLERIDTSHSSPNSLRARVRQRLSQLVDFYGLIAESRYLSEEGLSDTLNALVEVIRDSSKKTSSSSDHGNGDAEGALVVLPLSPASESFAEILLCEIALKNRDRFALVWNNILRAHYNSRLTYRPSHGEEEGHQPETIKLTPGIEKCVTGILRLCVWTSNGRDTAIANQVLSTLNILHPPFGALMWSPLELNLDKHLAEGLWRISRNVDGMSQIDAEGWNGVLGLVEWCATRGGLRSIVDQPGSLAEDDPSLQAFRSLHLILHAAELRESLQVYHWPQIVRSVRCLVEAGERGHCPKLSIAGLDLLQVLHTRMETLAANGDGVESQHLLKSWLPILEAICEPAEKSRNVSVRQQAISLLTDILLDRHGSRIPVESGLYEIMNTICIPLAGKRITDLLRIPYDVQNDLEETLIELELCISLLFKPFLHHLKALISVKQEFVGIWISMLGIMTQLLGEESLSQNNEVGDNGAGREGGAVTRAKLFQTTKELGSEHLRNAIMVLAAMGVLIDNDNGDATQTESNDAQEISSVTWAAIGSIGYCKPYLEEWKSSACQ